MSYGYSSSTGGWARHWHYHTDGVGSVTAMIWPSNGNFYTLSTDRYDPYGRLLGHTGTYLNPLRFNGKPRDARSGLHDYGFRWYEPETQRWFTRDPLGEWDGLNLYGFVGIDLVNGVDTYGLKPFDMFPDPNAAAKDAASYIHGHPWINDSGERCEVVAAVFKNKNGEYDYNIPWYDRDMLALGSRADFSFKIDSHDIPAGHIHNHIRGERFSNKNDPPKGEPKDIELYDRKGILGYLLTPTGKIKKYDPKTKKTITIGTIK